MSTLPIQNHLNRCVMIKCFLIASFTCKCIININNRYHLCGDWYFFTFQTIRVTLSIPSFMMPSADFPCGMHQWFILWKRHILDQDRTYFTVRFHDPKFFIGQSARFSYQPPLQVNIINLRKKWKGICSQVPFIVLKYRQGCI